MKTIEQMYNDYVATAGDSTPLGFEEWKASKAQNIDITRNLSEDDVAYIRYTDVKGDATPMSFADWVAAGKPKF